MTRAEMILKVVMSHAEPPNLFIDQYVRLVQGNLISVIVHMQYALMLRIKVILDLIYRSQKSIEVSGWNIMLHTFALKFEAVT